MSDKDIRILWQPSREDIQQSNLLAFMKVVDEDWDITITDFNGLYEFSIQEQEKFWQSLINFADVVAETWGKIVIKNPNQMPGRKGNRPHPSREGQDNRRQRLSSMQSPEQCHPAGGNYSHWVPCF